MHCNNLRLVLGLGLVRVSSRVMVRIGVKVMVSVMVRVSISSNKLGGEHGNWTTRGYANSRIANSQTGHLADWSTRGLTNAAKRTKTKHAKSPVASASCPVHNLSST